MASRFLVASAALAMLLPSSATAQDIHLAAGGTDQIWRGASETRAGTSLDVGTMDRGDGRRDLIIGAPGSPTAAGRVHIIFAGPVRTGTVDLTQADVVLSGAAGEEFGFATAAGNVRTSEGTNPRDLLVGAPGASSDRGTVYLFTGGFAHGDVVSEASAVFRVTGDPGDRLGTALATADLNRDGYREMIMGAPGSGRVYVVNGSPSLTGALAGASYVLAAPGVGSVLAAGDVNGDGIYDLLIGAPSENRVYLLKGRSGAAFSGLIDLRTQADAVLTGASAGDRAGATIRVCDLDGDGRSDMVIGAPDADGPAESRPEGGEVYLLWGSTTIASRNLFDADVTFFGGAGFHVGTHVSSGDINRDNPDDLVLFAPGGAGGEGELEIYYGRRRGAVGARMQDGRTAVDLTDPGAISRRIFGDRTVGEMHVTTVYEVTGEGARDVIVGVPNAQSGNGTVVFTVSPRLKLSSTTWSVTVPEGSSASTSLNVLNASSIPVTWQGTCASDGVLMSPDTGSASLDSNGQFTLSVSAALMPLGASSTSVTVESTSPHLTMRIPVSVNVTVTENRYVSMTTPAEGSDVSQPFTIGGWAVDTSAPSGTGVNRVDIYAYLNPGSGTPAVFLGTATYGLSSPDAAAVHGSRFANAGFTFSASNVPAGVNRIEALVYSVNGTTWTKPGGRLTVTVEPMPSDFDMDGDGLPDLLLERLSDGALIAWSMNGTTLERGSYLTPSRISDPAWRIVGSGDFNADGKRDLVWQNYTTGSLAVWFMDGRVRVSDASLSPNRISDPAWQIRSVVDLNGDHKPDLVWQHQNTGRVAYWLMDGVRRTTDGVIGETGSGSWTLVGGGDFDHDGDPDLLFRHQQAGYLTFWELNGTTLLAGRMLPKRVIDQNWQIQSVVDLNGDATPDLVWQNVADGRLAGWMMSGFALLYDVALSPARFDDLQWRVVAPR